MFSLWLGWAMLTSMPRKKIEIPIFYLAGLSSAGNAFIILSQPAVALDGHW